MSQVRQEEVGEGDNGQRLDRWLKKRITDVPQSLIFKLIRTGQVRVDGKRAKAEQKLVQGQVVRIPPANIPTEKKDVISEKDRAFIQSLVIYDDGDLIALNKPGDIATQGGTGTHRHIDGLLEGLKNKNGTKPRLVHRLDKETSGVLLLARSAEAVRELGYMFKGHDIEKIYMALVTPVPEEREGLIDAPMRKAGGKDRERIILDPEDGQPAKTDFKIIDHAGKRVAFVAFKPLTGRTHQIRVHSAYALNAPVIGDTKYGYDGEGLEGQVHAKRLHLHAARLSFKHPLTKKYTEIRAALPDDLAATWKAFGFDVKALIEFET